MKQTQIEGHSTAGLLNTRQHLSGERQVKTAKLSQV